MASGKRVVRFKEGEKAVGRSGGTKTLRNVAQLLEEAEASSAEKVAKTLEEQELLNLIDFGAVADAEEKSAAAVVKRVKAVILPAAKADKWKTKAGAEGAVKISPSTSSSIIPTKMVKLLAKLKKQKMFDTLFSVKLGEVKKYLGEDVLKPVLKVTTEAYGSVSLRLIKKRLEK